MITNSIPELFKHWEDRSQLVNRFFEWLKANPQQKKAVRAVSYHCETEGCTLLEVYPLKQGVLFYQPAYKLSPAVNEEKSSAEGRTANTKDGERRWSEQCGHLEGALNLNLNCDHIEDYSLCRDTILGDVEAAVTAGERKKVVISQN